MRIRNLFDAGSGMEKFRSEILDKHPGSATPVWRIRDVYPGSRILIFAHPGSRISDPGSKNSNKRVR
jgi:hypothetical protein